MSEHAVGVNDVKRLVWHKLELQVVYEHEMRIFVLQALITQLLERSQQDIRRNIGAIVFARIEVLNQSPPGAEVSAANVEDSVIRPQAVLEEIRKLHLANFQPVFT